MYSKTYGAWVRAGIDAWSLGVEASAVVGLRMAKLAAGGTAASSEAELMVAEKFQSVMMVAAGSLGLTPLGGTKQAIEHYRRKVAANRRRLSR